MSRSAGRGPVGHSGDPPPPTTTGDAPSAPRVSASLPPTVFIDPGEWNGEVETFRVWWIEIIDWVQDQVDAGVNNKRICRSVIMKMRGSARAFALDCYKQFESGWPAWHDTTQGEVTVKGVKTLIEERFLKASHSDAALKKLEAFLQNQ